MDEVAGRSRSGGGVESISRAVFSRLLRLRDATETRRVVMGARQWCCNAGVDVVARGG